MQTEGSEPRVRLTNCSLEEDPLYHLSISKIEEVRKTYLRVLGYEDRRLGRGWGYSQKGKHTVTQEESPVLFESAFSLPLFGPLVVQEAATTIPYVEA